ncbi:MAG TPA: cyclic nucleotide-binding domain-containing protein, partial [Candidatus Caenarcaniphilales bacterium]
MAQTVSPLQIQAFLAKTTPFNQLGVEALQKLVRGCRLLRYRMGQPLVSREKMPAQLVLIYEGEARLLGYDPRTQTPVSLRLLGSGEILGWVGLVRGVPCETAIASTETIGLVIPALDF